MPKRQVILLILMGLALIYGASTLFDSMSKPAEDPTAGARKAELDKISTQVKELLDGQKLSDVELYRLALLSGEGVTDPLIKRAPGDDQVAGVDTRTGDARFTYSAYMLLGGMEMAVINDEECGLGDPVADTGYTLAALTRDAATVQGNNPETGAVEKILIPIQEDILSFPEQSKTTDEETDEK